MPYMVIVSDDMGRVSIHEDLDGQGVKDLIQSPSISAEDSVEIFEYVREVDISEFKEQPKLADQEIPLVRFAQKPVGRCNDCKEDVFMEGRVCNCKNCGPRKNADMELYFYPS